MSISLIPSHERDAIIYTDLFLSALVKGAILPTLSLFTTKEFLKLQIEVETLDNHEREFCAAFIDFLEKAEAAR